MNIIDETFGELNFNYVWERDLQTSLFDKKVITKLGIGTSKEVPCSLQQKSTFLHLTKNIENVNANVISALFIFYKENMEEFREYIPMDDWGRQAPLIETEHELEKLILLENINICDTKDKTKRVVYYFSTTFEDELGVSVIIINGAVSEVATDVLY